MYESGLVSLVTSNKNTYIYQKMFLNLLTPLLHVKQFSEVLSYTKFNTKSYMIDRATTAS